MLRISRHMPHATRHIVGHRNIRERGRMDQSWFPCCNMFQTREPIRMAFKRISLSNPVHIYHTLTIGDFIMHNSFKYNICMYIMLIQFCLFRGRINIYIFRHSTYFRSMRRLLYISCYILYISLVWMFFGWMAGGALITIIFVLHVYYSIYTMDNTYFILGEQHFIRTVCAGARACLCVWGLFACKLNRRNGLGRRFAKWTLIVIIVHVLCILLILYSVPMIGFRKSLCSLEQY